MHKTQINRIHFIAVDVSPITATTSATKFLWANHPSPGQILSKWLDKRFHCDQLYSWYFGAHSIEKNLALGIAFVLFMISLIGMGKESPYLGCSVKE